MPTFPSGYYCYMLVDPKNGLPFYVGKGQRGRAWQHALAVARGDFSGNSRKVAKIQEILKRGDEVEIQIIGEYDLEDDALEHEFELVDSLSGLTNVMPGGGGRTLKPEEIQRREAAREARIIEARKKNYVQLAELREAKRQASFLGKSVYAKHQDEIKLWLENTKPEPVNIKYVSVKKLKGKGTYVTKLMPPTRPPKRDAAVSKENERLERMERYALQARLDREARIRRQRQEYEALSPRQKEILKH